MGARDDPLSWTLSFLQTKKSAENYMRKEGLKFIKTSKRKYQNYAWLSISLETWNLWGILCESSQEWKFNCRLLEEHNVHCIIIESISKKPSLSPFESSWYKVLDWGSRPLRTTKHTVRCFYLFSVWVYSKQASALMPCYYGPLQLKTHGKALSNLL